MTTTTEMPRQNVGKQIKTKKRGNALGFYLFEVMFRLFGLKGAYFLLQFVATHYLLFDQKAVSDALPYIRKRFPQSSWLQERLHVRRLFVNQGKQLIDRFVITQRPEYYKYHQLDSLETLTALQSSSKGAVMVTSHVGNWQVALMQMGHLKKNISIVMRPEDNPAVKEHLALDSKAAKPMEIIDPQGEFGGVLKMIDALNEGRLVCLMGDRGYGFDTIKVPFLGAPAYFPYGAFSIAAATGCPVVALMTHKISNREYIVDISKIWWPTYSKQKDKKNHLKQWLMAYVEHLEKFIQEHPYDCFLFHNVWNQEKRSFK